MPNTPLSRWHHSVPYIIMLGDKNHASHITKKVTLHQTICNMLCCVLLYLRHLHVRAIILLCLAALCSSASGAFCWWFCMPVCLSNFNSSLMFASNMTKQHNGFSAFNSKEWRENVEMPYWIAVNRVYFSRTLRSRIMAWRLPFDALWPVIINIILM